METSRWLEQHCFPVESDALHNLNKVLEFMQRFAYKWKCLGAQYSQKNAP